MKLEGVMTELLSHGGAHPWPSFDFRVYFGCCHLWGCFIGMAYGVGALHGSGLPPLPAEKGRGKSKLTKPKPVPFPVCCWIGWLSAGHCFPSAQDRGSLVGWCTSDLSSHQRLGCGSLPNSYVVIFGDRVFIKKNQTIMKLWEWALIQ